MDSLFNQLFTLVLLYGYPAVAGAEFASSAGVPLPMTALLLLAGSMAAVGSLQLAALVPLVAACGVAGDLVDYYAGRRVGNLATTRIAGRGFLESGAVTRAQQLLARWSGAGIFLSRWLFTPIGSLVSVLAGIAHYPLRKFLIAAAVGELVSAALYLGVGYAVGESWPEIWSFLSSVPGLATATVAGLALVGAGVARLLHARRR
jgi:membrane-associated protein